MVCVLSVIEFARRISKVFGICVTFVFGWMRTRNSLAPITCGCLCLCSRPALLSGEKILSSRARNSMREVGLCYSERSEWTLQHANLHAYLSGLLEICCTMV